MAEDIVARLVLQGQQYFSTINQAGQRTQKFQKDTQQGFRTISGAIQTATKALVAYGAVRILQTIGRQITQTAMLAGNLADLSRQLNLSTQSIQVYRFAAERAGVSNQQLDGSFESFTRRMGEFTRSGTGPAASALKTLGLSLDDIKSRSPEQQLALISDRMATMTNRAEQVSVADGLFSEKGRDLVRVLGQGSAALKVHAAEAERLGVIMGDDLIANAEQFNDRMDDFTNALQGLTQKGIGPLLPPLTQFLELLTQMVALDFESLGFRFSTVFQDMGTSLRLMAELLADPLNFEATLKKYEALDKKFQAERRKRFAKPEEASGPVDTLPGVTVTEQKKSAELAGLIALREARIKLIEAEEAAEDVKSDRVNILHEEIALLNEALAIQKEIEAANTTGKERAVDENVAITARIEKEARLTEIQNERAALIKQLAGDEQEILGTEILHAARVKQGLNLQLAKNDLTREEAELQRAIARAGDDESLVRGGNLLLLEARINFLKIENEVLGETKARNEEIKQLLQQQNDIREEGLKIEQESLGRGIVQAATADVEGQIAPFRKALRDAQQEVQVGEILPGQHKDTNTLRRIEELKAEIELVKKEEALGLVSAEESTQRFLLADAKLRAETAQTQKGFFEGWHDVFAKFTNDTESAFGLGQTLARNFVTNLQTTFSSVIGSVFDHLEKGTLTWKTALETVPAILKRITAELIAMLVVQTIAKALGAPTVPVSGMSTGGGAGGGGGGFGNLFGGLFGGGGGGAAAGGILAAQGRGAANPALFGPGFASGGSFMVDGPAGTDRTHVAFKATKGERVDVLTPDQQRSGGGLKVEINNYGSDRVSTHMAPDGKTLKVLIEATAVDSMRNGKLRREMKSFGVSRQPRTG